MPTPRSERIEANCKVIWGPDSDYDLDLETDDYVNYACHVKKDFGLSYGPILAMTSLCPSEDAALAELDRMLLIWAEQVKRGTPMTKDETLSIYSGYKGEYTSLISDFMYKKEKAPIKAGGGCDRS